MGVSVGVFEGVGVLVGIGVFVGVSVGVSDGKINAVGNCAARLSELLLSQAAKGKRSTMAKRIHDRILDMVHLRTLMLLTILICAAACQNQPSTPREQAVLPTTFILPSPTPEPSISPIPSEIPTFTPEITLLPSPLTPTEIAAAVTEIPTATFQAIVIPSLQPTEAPPATPRVVVLPERFSFGKSLLGNDLTARVMGGGSNIIMLVGGIHAGFEANTVTLVQELTTFFEQNPAQVLPGTMIIFIPTLNPDGAAQGRVLQGRFNANGVDLNRNWGCGWDPEAYFQDQPVNPGSGAFSEPETLQLAALINDVRPSVVLFYHSAANGVYGGNCNGTGNSSLMVSVLGNATGYPFGQAFDDYVVTGTASNWVDSIGIPAADVELATSDAPEFERNLRGVMALQCWLLGADGLRFDVCAQ